MGTHLAQLYTAEDALLHAAEDFAAAGLGAGEAVIVISTVSRWKSLQRGLQEKGHDVAHAVLHGHLRFAAMQWAFLSPAPEADALPALRIAVRSALIRHRSARVFNDISDFLHSRRRRAAALRLETALQAFADEHPLSVLCAARFDSLEAQAYCGPLQDLCASHMHVLPERDARGLDQAVDRALGEVLGPVLAGKVIAVASTERRAADTPFAYHIMLWLTQHMPRTAGKVLARLRP